LILDLKKKHPTLMLIDPSEVLCAGNYCHYVIDGIPVYYNNTDPVGIQNNGHLTAAASEKNRYFILEKP
jgi:hypothetical protein